MIRKAPIFILMLALLIPGVLIAYVLPMIPYVMWMAGVCGWLILVCEAMIAVPLWMLAHMTVGGDGLHGPDEYADTATIAPYYRALTEFLRHPRLE